MTFEPNTKLEKVTIAKRCNLKILDTLLRFKTTTPERTKLLPNFALFDFFGLFSVKSS